ncbi:MAG: hypothetical protein HW411_600 [Gammaproteobacteria bacterium]|nr:hypothetical protein [Gammaproteobacteria bacterium]
MIKRFPISYKIAILNVAVFLILCISIVFIGSLTLNSDEMRQQGTERQDLNIRVAWELINKLGDDIQLIDDKLYAGEHVLNGDNQLVDRVANLVGGTATIFMRDIRVATNVMKEDGTRAIGTAMAQGPVYDAIFKQGVPFRGEADILGTEYFTAYDPIKNAAGEVIGIVYVGIIKDEFFAATKQILSNIIFTVIGFGFLACVISFFAVRQIVMQPVHQSVSFSKDIADGNLACDIKIDRKDELGDLFESLKIMQTKLTEVIRGIRSGANEVTVSSEQVARGNTDLSQRTQEQASSLEEVASSMEEMTSTVNQNAENAVQANQLAIKAREQADAGGAVVNRAVTAMDGISDASKKIADIIGVIDEIAFQTNLLALNAAVEAARAGEQGRGFAVVASEVRNLAGRCKTAAKEIKGLIQDSVERVRDGTKLVDESGQALEEIVRAVKKLSDIVAEIAAASQEQSEGIAQVNRALLQMDETTQQNASLVEQAAAASEAMGAQAEELGALVAYFKLNENEDVQSARALRVSTGKENTAAGSVHKLNAQRTNLPQVLPEDVADDSDWHEF